MSLRPGSLQAQALFKATDISLWKSALASYDTCVEAIQSRGNKTTKQLVADDEFWRNELPGLLKSQGFISHAQLVRVVRWKFGRGKWRPTMRMIQNNSSSLVETSSREALSALSAGSLESAMKHLLTLRGVGPATASAVFAATDPTTAPFFADEAMEAIPGFGKRKYTTKAYFTFQKALINRSKELGTEWTPELVGRALWAKAKLSENEKNAKGKKKREEKENVHGPVDVETTSPPLKRTKTNPFAVMMGAAKHSEAVHFKGCKLPPGWSAQKTCLVRWFESEASKKSAKKPPTALKTAAISAFDFDGCICKGNSWNQNLPALELPRDLVDGVYESCHSLCKVGYFPVIISNGASIGRMKKPKTILGAISRKTKRIDSVLQHLQLPLPVLVLVATSKEADGLRKWNSKEIEKGLVPESCIPGGSQRKDVTHPLWELVQQLMKKKYCLDVDNSSSFYVGDAAGRQKDHSDCDMIFAKASGIQFWNEDVFFIKKNGLNEAIEQIKL